MSKYFTKRRPWIPEEEIIRYYGKQGDLHPAHILFDSDFEDEDDV